MFFRGRGTYSNFIQKQKPASTTMGVTGSPDESGCLPAPILYYVGLAIDVGYRDDSTRVT